MNRELFDEMFRITKKYYNDVWLEGIEYTLWDELQRFKNGEETRVKTEDLVILDNLSKKTGGWYVWPDKSPEFVDLKTIEEKFSKRYTLYT